MASGEMGRDRKRFALERSKAITIDCLTLWYSAGGACFRLRSDTQTDGLFTHAPTPMPTPMHPGIRGMLSSLLSVRGTSPLTPRPQCLLKDPPVYPTLTTLPPLLFHLFLHHLGQTPFP